MQKCTRDIDRPRVPWFPSTMRREWWGTLLVALLILTSSLPVQADEEFRLFWGAEAVGNFLHKQDKSYIPLFSPTSDGTIRTISYSGWYGADGLLGVGLVQYKVSTIEYSQELGKLYYDLYKNKDLKGTYTHLAGRITSYHRQDLVMDVNLAHGPWQVKGGLQLMEGSDLLCFDIQDATASRIEGNEIPYDVRGRYALWKGYADDRGYGLGYHFTLHYQPTERVSVTLLGSDLGASLLWRPIDEYHGTVNLDLVREENGVDYVHAPLEGIYLPDGWLRVPLTPLWHTRFVYHISPAVTVDPWLEYSGGWEAGLRSTLTLQHELTLSLGMAWSHGQWCCQVGGEWAGAAAEFAANLSGPITSYQLGVQVGAF